jgi:hypothetical protein
MKVRVRLIDNGHAIGLLIGHRAWLLRLPFSLRPSSWLYVWRHRNDRPH